MVSLSHFVEILREDIKRCHCAKNDLILEDIGDTDSRPMYQAISAAAPLMDLTMLSQTTNSG